MEAAVLWTPLRAAHRTWKTGRPVFHKLPHPSLSRICVKKWTHTTRESGHFYFGEKRTFLLWSDIRTSLIRPIDSKENGIDIEGIAVRDGVPYVGFRGPVLRGNDVPVLVVKQFDIASDHELRFVNLGGLGIRDLVAVHGGFLVLAGAVGDAQLPYELWFWTGDDALEGTDRAANVVTRIGNIPTEGGKAEGITVTNETDDTYDLIVVYDSLADGGAARFSVTKA